MTLLTLLQSQGAGGFIAGQAAFAFSTAAELTGDGALTGASSLTFTTAADLTGSGGAGANIEGATTLTFTPSATAFGGAVIEAASTVTFTAAGDITGSGASGDISGSTSLTFALLGALAGASIVSGATTLTFTASATATPEAGGQTRGGFYTKEDRKRHKRLSELAVQRRDTQRDEQDAFRSALEDAYDAVLGLVDEPAAETRAEVREAIADAAQAAPEPYRAEVQKLRDLARQAKTLTQIERVVTRIAAIQARAEADADDDETVLMLIG